tara:strand:- start:1209 stop:1454 length:246 start_codon:yes stop_codon:yes gene_type:complete
MGRAIDMEKDIDMLKLEVEKLNNIIRGMSSELTEVTDALFEEEEEETKEKASGKKETNAKGNGKGNKSSDTADGDADTKSK